MYIVRGFLECLRCRPRMAAPLLIATLLSSAVGQAAAREMGRSQDQPTASAQDPASKNPAGNPHDDSQQAEPQASGDDCGTRRVVPPIERSDDKHSKATFATYFLPGDRDYDINLRHQFGANLVAWVAGFFDENGSQNLGRVGAQYGFKYKWISFQPALEVGFNGALSGSLYSELGYKNYGIVGYSETNLKPFSDLFFDPSEAVTLGVGRHLSCYDKISGYSIFDVRLHTHQQNTHIQWRHRLNGNNGITFDFLYKSGFGDGGHYIRTAGIGVYYDRPNWFWKLYVDPHVNFTADTMVRLGFGVKF